jgi:hypothetical protein
MIITGAIVLHASLSIAVLTIFSRKRSMLLLSMALGAIGFALIARGLSI